MDPVTHAALGAAIAQTVLVRYNRTIPWKAGALAALAPDLDVLIRFSEPLSAELWHRSFTHSLLFIPFGAAIVTLFLCLFSSFRQHWRITFVATLLGYATHGLLDACTTYGTQLIWPWTNRISWDIVAIIDPWVTVPLVLGTAWSVVNNERKVVVCSLGFVAAFFLFNIMQHQRALNAIEIFAQHNRWQLHSVRAIPALASSTHWQIVAKQNNCIVIAEAHTPLWGASTVTRPLMTQQFRSENYTFSLTQQRTLNIFRWFTEDYMMVAKTDPLTLADARYIMSLDPLYSLWGIQFLPKEPFVRDIRGVIVDERCTQ